MGSESLLPTNTTPMTKPASDKSMCTLDTPTTATMDSPSQSQNFDDSFGDRGDLTILRTPPTRTSMSTINLALAVVVGDSIELDESKKMKLTKRLSSAMKLQVNRPPIADDIDEKKVSTKNLQSLSLKSLVPGSISQRDALGDNSHERIGPSLDKNRQGIKERISLSESMDGKSRDNDSFNRLNCPGNFDFELYPSMKLRATYSDDPAQSSDHEDSQEVLARVPVSPGQNLPLPKGFKKHRKVSYRIRFAIPELENITEDSNNFDNEDKDAHADESAVGRGGIRGIRGFNRSNNWASYPESETENNMTCTDGDDRDDDDHMSEIGSYSLPPDEQSETNSEMSCGGFRENYPPDVLVTPIKSKDGSRKWIAKRVWDMEDRDDEEPEYEVDHWCLMHGIRGLMGIPEEMGMTSEEWQVNIDESDPWDMSANKDSAPKLPKRTRDNYRPQLSVQKLFALDGQYEESTSLLLNAENYRAQLKHVTFAQLEQDLTDYSALSDLGSDASDVCSFDYFYFSDNSSFTVSIQTTSTDELSYQSEDEPEDSLGNFKFSNHSQRGFGRPNEWVRPKDVYQESFESKCSRHRRSSFGISDDWWVSSSESDEGSPECRSWRSPVMSRTEQDKSARESSPEDDTPHSRKGGRRKPPTCEINLEECKTPVGDMTEAHNGVNKNSAASEGKKYRDSKHQKKTKKITKGRKKKAIDNSLSLAMLNTCSIQLDSDSDSEDGYNGVTLTWEKRPLQESEKELNTKMWWDF